MSTTRPNRALVAVALSTGALLIALVVLAVGRLGRDATPVPTATVGAPTYAPTTTAPAVPPVSPTPAHTPAATPTTVAPPAETSSAPAPSPRPTAARARVTVTVTVAGWVPTSGTAEVSGFADVVESGGTCTLTLTQGNRRASASGSTSPDASTTSCGTLSISRASLAPGTWTGKLAYGSATASGESDTFTIEVPA